MLSRGFLAFVLLLGSPCSLRAASLVTSYELTGSFQRNGKRADLAWARPREGIASFDSFGGSDARTGGLRTAIFRAPAQLHFFVSGFPGTPGMRLYLWDEMGNRSIDLSNRVDPGDKWRMHYWQIPKSWQGVPVRLVAEDNAPNSWVGVTLPEAGGQNTGFSLARALARNALVVLSGILFLLPGLAGCVLLSLAGVRFDLKQAVCAVLAISSVCGLCIFAFYILSPRLGRPASLLLMFGSTLVVGIFYKRVFREPTALRLELAACLSAVLLAGVFNCSLGNLYTTDDEPGEYAQVRYRAGMPPDNVLPQIFAEKLYRGDSVRPTLLNYWQSSDRPPLETAIFLLERRMVPVNQEALAYQSLGIFLQCTWIAGVWVLLRTAGVRVRHIAFCLSACLFSYFCLFHTFYVWAKLLSATFLFLGLSFFPFIRGSLKDDKVSWTALDGTLTGSALALSMLCHPGVAFTIAGLLAVAAYSRSLPPFRVSAVAAACALALLLPWQAYQKFYDPPGDNLMKAHLAGVIDFEHSLTQCIVAAYSKLTFHQWALNKWANIKILFWGNILTGVTPWNTNRVLKELIESSFFYLFFAVGFLNAGFPVRFFHRGEPALARLGGQFLTIAAISLILWCLVMFDPGSTVVHQGSFATVLLLFVGLALWLVNGAPKLAVALLLIQVTAVFPIFVFDRPFFNRPGTIGDAPLSLAMAFAATASLAGFVLLFRRVSSGALLAGDLQNGAVVVNRNVQGL